MTISTMIIPKNNEQGKFTSAMIKLLESFIFRILNDEDFVAANWMIDSANFGGLPRFFNHECSEKIGKLRPQLIFDNRQDQRCPTIAFFTTQDIQKGCELTWDYNVVVPRSTKTERQRLKFPCYCQSKYCRKYLIKLTDDH